MCAVRILAVKGTLNIASRCGRVNMKGLIFNCSSAKSKARIVSLAVKIMNN